MMVFEMLAFTIHPLFHLAAAGIDPRLIAMSCGPSPTMGPLSSFGLLAHLRFEDARGV